MTTFGLFLHAAWNVKSVLFFALFFTCPSQETVGLMESLADFLRHHIYAYSCNVALLLLQA